MEQINASESNGFECTVVVQVSVEKDFESYTSQNLIGTKLTPANQILLSVCPFSLAKLQRQLKLRSGIFVLS